VVSGAPSWIDFVRFGISTTFDAGGGTADGFGSIDGDGGSVRGGDVGGGSGSRSISARQRAQIDVGAIVTCPPNFTQVRSQEGRRSPQAANQTGRNDIRTRLTSLPRSS